jgi:phosphate transport system substrate-binding protein
MFDRPHAIRAIAGRVAIGLAVAATLVFAACGTPSTTTGTSATANPSLTACSVSSSDLTPTNPGATNTAPSVSGVSGQKLSIDGSTALQPLVKQAAGEFDKTNSSLTTVNAGGSGQGIKDVQAGAVQIGMSDVFANTKAPTTTPNIYNDLVDHQVAAVVFTLVTNNDLSGKVDNLTQSQIQDVYTGVDTNWSQVGGPNEAITVINRPTTSGTRSTFDKYVLDGKTEITGDTLTEDSTGAVASAVSATKGSIGYVSIGFAVSYGTQVHPICIGGAKAVASDVNSGAYNFWGIEHMYTKGPATGLAKDEIEYVLSSGVQSNDLLALSYLQLSTVSASAITAHTPAGEPAPETLTPLS